ncbi:CRTAC1 family protein [Pseudomarimonas salicorniae]|uniref:CRTAC1 family protein n=1 Tax=Pseudomarimonas salicorniae TaxID=2933270 RepID=A0ABT0GEM3_9GAMM|nr:CRTAC1 family protein [Lysobacter sp. CAU 1642]MCK7592996.1 CRTAC1 family protein [Lysobacter sp. CAU 1642]
MTPLRTALLAVLATTALPATAADWLVEVTAEAGIDFRYEHGGRGEFYFPEIMGAGIGVLDADGDGLMDLYLVQGGDIGPGIDPGKRKQGDRLLLNRGSRGSDGRWNWRFEDATEASGIRARGYGMGVAVGDIDGDGDDDLYVLNFGANQLWRNDGKGRFTDITASAGVGDPRWSVSASFADLDGDGLPELYVANYVDYDFDTHKRCRSPGGGEIDYCSPSAYPPVADSLYRNLGDGRFEDVSEASGIAGQKGPGLGVVALDVNGDGRRDLYVANDGRPNFLWINQGGLRFVDDAVLAGAAVNADGAAEAGMGIAVADVDRNGHEDLFVTHMRNESNTLYLGVGQGWFEDRTARAGLAASSLGFTGFGTAFVDLDLDGWEDIVIANGGVIIEPDPLPAERGFPYLQTDQVYLHNGRGGEQAAFAEKSTEAGAALRVRGVTRGLAVADFDNDGRPDIALGNINGPARLLAHRGGAGRHWLGLDLRDSKGRRIDGAIVSRTGPAAPLRRSRRDGSYASAQDPRVWFGLGEDSVPVDLLVKWPDGRSERFDGLAVDRYHRLQAGQGKEAAQ